MPNIELHGYGDKSTEIRDKIRETLKRSPDADEIVTTINWTEVTDLNGDPMPFLRVFSTEEGLEELLELLDSLDEDIELMMLGRWIPKKI